MNMPMGWVENQTESTWPPRIDDLVECFKESNWLLKSTFNAGSWQNPSNRGMHFVISKIEKCCSHLHNSNDVHWMKSAFEDYAQHFCDLFDSNEVLQTFDSMLKGFAKNKQYHQKYDQVIEINSQRLTVCFTKTHKGVFVFAFKPIKSI